MLRSRSRSRSARDETGTAAVEFALVLPLLLVVSLALVQVGLLVRDRLLVEEATRAGTRAAAIGSDPSEISGAALRAAPDLDPDAMTIDVARAGSRGDPVTVTVNYTSAIKVPLVAWLFGSGVAMRASSTDRQEFG
jgi:Flp pilus assembly protein TadG